MLKWQPISEYNNPDHLKCKNRVDKTYNKIFKVMAKSRFNDGITTLINPFNEIIYYPIHDVMLDATHLRGIRFQ